MKLKHIYHSSSEANHKTKKIVILFGSEKVTKINLPATKHKFHITIHVFVVAKRCELFAGQQQNIRMTIFSINQESRIAEDTTTIFLS
jgi:hypothetical protein